MMKVRRVFQTVLPLMVLLFVTSCSSDDDDDTGNWVRYSDFEGVTRGNAISFVIDDYAYVGLGTDGDDYLLDFWRYDFSKNYWEKMAEFPGVGRVSAVSFSADGKGYVGTGYNKDLEEEELADFWEYDPETNAWTQKADFIGGARYEAIGFGIDSYGYIGTGYDGNYLKDMYKYDPSSDSWTSVVSLYGTKREGAVAFVMNGKAYVGTGRNNGSYLYDFWVFDPTTETWDDLSLNDDDDDTYDEFVAAMGRYGAVAFVMDDVAYIGTGIADAYSSDMYAYYPETNEWDDEITAFEGYARTNAVAFTVGGMGYITTGNNGSQRFDDLRGFDPTEEYEEND